MSVINLAAQFLIFQGTQAKEKNELLIKEFGIDYNELEIMFRQGSLAFWQKVFFLLFRGKFSIVQFLCTRYS